MQALRGITSKPSSFVHSMARFIEVDDFPPAIYTTIQLTAIGERSTKSLPQPPAKDEDSVIGYQLTANYANLFKDSLILHTKDSSLAKSVFDEAIRRYQSFIASGGNYRDVQGLIDSFWDNGKWPNYVDNHRRGNAIRFESLTTTPSAPFSPTHYKP